MRLSSDGLTLLEVFKKDLTRGAFIVPHGVTTIGEGAFERCSNLTQVTIPHSVTTIGYRAFLGCTGLTQLTIPHGVTTIGQDAFFGCFSLTQVTIPHSVTTIGIGAFGATGLTQLTIPHSVTTIGIGAFGATDLAQITIPHGVTTIGWRAFAGCTGLTKITLAGGQRTTIDPSAFDGCNIQEIVVNTDDAREIERIKNMLPMELRDKVIKNPVYHEVIKYQEETLRPVLLRDAILRDMTKYHKFISAVEIPTDTVSLIAAFDEDTNNHVNNKIHALGFPVTSEELVSYQNRMPGVLDEMRKQQEITEKRLPCAMKLQEYVDFLGKSKQEKRNTFFAENSDLLGQIDRKLSVTEKIIRWLKGKENQPTEEEISICDPYVIGVLNKFSIQFQQEDAQASAESKTNTPVDQGAYHRI
jgi:hypothetical protein